MESILSDFILCFRFFVSTSFLENLRYPCHGIAINFATNTSLVDVTIHCAPGFGLAEVRPLCNIC